MIAKCCRSGKVPAGECDRAIQPMVVAANVSVGAPLRAERRQAIKRRRAPYSQT
jgi:hypothetical protein